MSGQNVLVHHGIKGMKWGIRRTPEQLGHAPSKKRKFSIKISRPESEKQTVSKASSEPKKKKNSAKEMSDEELRSIINRIEMVGVLFESLSGSRSGSGGGGGRNP